MNGEKINATYAFSGLAMEYAPWRAWEDGSEVQDDERYTVAAWATSIDETYIASTLNVHCEF